MLLPVSLGGGGADIVTFNRVIEAIAAADASTGLVHGAVAGELACRRLSRSEIAREVFGAPEAIVAWGPPGGLDQGASGRRRLPRRPANGGSRAAAPMPPGWAAIRRSTSATASRASMPAGRPVMRTMIFRPAQATIHDTWHVIGLRGTASNDYEVADLFVPRAVHAPGATQARTGASRGRSTTSRC